MDKDAVVTGDPRKDAYAADPFICTRYGQFHINSPEFNIEDIGHALGMLCRYTGHVRSFYSVAEHSMLVAGIMATVTGGDPFEGLMHDAAEAYLTDIATPWKVLLPDYASVTKRIEVPLRTYFGVPVSKTDECRKADLLALFIEANQLMEDRGVSYHDPLGVRPEALQLVAGDHMAAPGKKFRTHSFEPAFATHMFMEAYKHYGKKIVSETGRIVAANP